MELAEARACAQNPRVCRAPGRRRLRVRYVGLHLLRARWARRTGVREFEVGVTADVPAEAVCVRRRECVAARCAGSGVAPLRLKESPLRQPGRVEASRFDSRRLCGPRSRVVCLSRLSFKGGARRARLPRFRGRPLLLKGRLADLTPHKAESGRNTFHRDYKPHGQTMSTSILLSLTHGIS